jgi:hypothetical protein
MKTFPSSSITILTIYILIRSSSVIHAQESCTDILKSHGISLENTDIQLLSDNPSFCDELTLLVKTDTTAFSIASAQILIKLESNELFNLSPEQIDSNEALLTGIIHGAFKEHGLGDQTLLSAKSWYQIFMAQMKEE